MKKKLSRGFIWPPLLVIGTIIIGSYLFATTLEKKSGVSTSDFFNQQKSENYDKKGTVQMGNLKFGLPVATVAPFPTALPDSCNRDTGAKADLTTCSCPSFLVKCEENRCVDYDAEKSGFGTKYKTKDEACAVVDNSNTRWCETIARQGDGWYCLGKPVIYLYPEKPTLVDVRVETEGEIFVSDPQIEYYSNQNSGGLVLTKRSEGGWTDVLAHPDGILLYKNKTYKELFYESVTRDVKRPEKGIVIEKKNLQTGLLTFITRLGLTKTAEQLEFLDWWLPQLEKLPADKIFVSILEKDEKERLDKVYINPKPDTFIEFIVYFAPLKKNETVDPLVLHPTPQRIGFTAIEWGGVIGK